MITLLDIGAGSTFFARQFIARNTHLGDIRAFCAEPDWSGEYCPYAGTGWWRRVYKIQSRYEQLMLPGSSVDVLALNAYMFPNRPGKNFPHEVVRVLKPNGVFISAHPIGEHPDLSEVGLMQFGGDTKTFGFTADSDSFLTKFACCIPDTRLGTLHVPASQTNMDRIWVLRDNLPKSTGYIYSRTRRGPSVQVWQRPQ